MRTYKTTYVHFEQMKNGGTVFATIKECNAELKRLKNVYLFPELLLVAKVRYNDSFGAMHNGGYTVASCHDDHLN